MFTKIVEAKIQEAIRKGEFDNLPSKGQPINLDDWAKLPEDIRAGYMLLKNAGYRTRRSVTVKGNRSIA